MNIHRIFYIIPLFETFKNITEIQLFFVVGFNGLAFLYVLLNTCFFCFSFDSRLSIKNYTYIFLYIFRAEILFKCCKDNIRIPEVFQS